VIRQGRLIQEVVGLRVRLLEGVWFIITILVRQYAYVCAHQCLCINAFSSKTLARPWKNSAFHVRCYSCSALQPSLPLFTLIHLQNVKMFSVKMYYNFLIDWRGRSKSPLSLWKSLRYAGLISAAHLQGDNMSELCLFCSLMMNISLGPDVHHVGAMAFGRSNVHHTNDP
jgi:hypothetical protein